MRILFIADGRSPISLNWLEYFVAHGHEVHLVSSFTCAPMLNLASIHEVSLAFSGLKSRTKPASETGNPKRSGIWGAATVKLRTKIRQWYGPLTLPGVARKIAEIILEVKPDLVHAMRIPYEGMAGAEAKKLLGSMCPPLLISVWGNDFTLHASSTPLMNKLTRSALEITDGLHTDCYRDLRLAQEWGFATTKPAIVLPGAGGIQMDLFFPPKNESPQSAPLVINPRGIRAYVRNDTFFKAIPLVLEEIPDVRFCCPGMQGESQAELWLDIYNIRPFVNLMPKISRQEMADLFRATQVAVSPSTHDGTPNTLLEAMACGCFPVAGDLESLREWIEPGENGFLVDIGDPHALSQAVIVALSDPVLRNRAAQKNRQLIAERADYRLVMRKALAFYQQLIA
jgi:glycosyltransferase involved in cell wall biosynthesis